MTYLRRPVAFAHRGGAALWPENTLEAFRFAIEIGFRYIETDLHTTRDGHVVCFHDATVDRTTDGVGRVHELDLAELKALDAGYRFTDDGRTFPFRGRGFTTPTLEEALALHPNLRLNVEIKQRAPAMEEILWSAIDALGAHDRILVAAEHDALAERFRALRPGSPVPTSAGVRGVLRFWIGARTGLHRVERYPFQALQVPVSYAGLPIVDARFIAAAHAHGLHVHVWTIDEESEMHRLLELGADAIMTDRPDRLAAVFHARGLSLDGSRGGS
ncbi:MAG: glycerophosphodiester phosphodiesterase [Sandaracinaceae bacterium]|nr:glycerophosphodiester phosphodiesterase [Sandaracinaceae bacterium]